MMTWLRMSGRCFRCGSQHRVADCPMTRDVKCTKCGTPGEGVPQPLRKRLGRSVPRAAATFAQPWASGPLEPHADGDPFARFYAAAAHTMSRLPGPPQGDTYGARGIL
eukprot:GHVR01067686.1.p2 GENE.GHVR01067686.1~~GHVR01067686.1.p2  ORF type:complete len:108 (+),score=16.49 GHVR01067686.1:203-526(+)